MLRFEHMALTAEIKLLAWVIFSAASPDGQTNAFECMLYGELACMCNRFLVCMFNVKNFEFLSPCFEISMLKKHDVLDPKAQEERAT